MNDKSNKNTAEMAFPPIDLATANEIIRTYKAIKDRMTMSFPQVPPGLSRTDLGTFNRDIKNYNGFIFEKGEVLKMFNAGASHLMVVLGAHPKVENQFPHFGKGSFTVVVAGCTSTTPTDGNSEEYTAVEYASEYPPRTVVSELKQADLKHKEGGTGENLIFKVKE